MKPVVFELEPYDAIPGWWQTQGPAGGLIGRLEDFQELSAWFTVLGHQARQIKEAQE